MSKGFTLIEAVIYIALLGLLMVSAVSVAYQILQGSANTSARTTVQDEGNFVLRKINWALSGVQTVNSPAGWGSSLSLTKYDGTTVDMCVKNNIVWMRENKTGGTCGDSSYASTTTSNVNVSSLSVHHIPVSGTAPEGLEASTTINGLVFYTEHYIRN